MRCVWKSAFHVKLICPLFRSHRKCHPRSTLRESSKPMIYETNYFQPAYLSVLSSSVKNSWALKMGQICCPETSIQNYHSRLRNISEERRYPLHRNGSLKSRGCNLVGTCNFCNILNSETTLKLWNEKRSLFILCLFWAKTTRIWKYD
jgi:hypothetical protein